MFVLRPTRESGALRRVRPRMACRGLKIESNRIELTPVFDWKHRTLLDKLEARA